MMMGSPKHVRWAQKLKFIPLFNPKTRLYRHYAISLFEENDVDEEVDKI